MVEFVIPYSATMFSLNHGLTLMFDLINISSCILMYFGLEHCYVNVMLCHVMSSQKGKLFHH